MTERERHAEWLSETRQLTARADSLAQLAWITNPAGHIEWFNRRWYDYTGADVKSAPLELPASDPWGSLLHPDDVDQSRKAWKRSVATGDSYEVEHRLRRNDGVYCWFLVHATPIRDEDGRISRWFGTCTNIENYKNGLAAAHKAVAETQFRMKAVLDAASSQISIIATDTAGVIQVFNSGAEKMLGYRAEEVVGMSTPAILHLQSECELRSRELTQELGRPVTGMGIFIEPVVLRDSDERDWTYVRKDSSTLEVRLVCTAVRNIAGAITGYLGIAMDITAQKALERELRETNAGLLQQTERSDHANRAKSAFLAAMSHEIRTPMNAILGMSDLLWESQLDPEQRQYVEVFRRAGNNLLTLINDILDLSKIEAGNLELDRVVFELDDVTTRSLELIQPAAHGKGLAVLCRVAPDVPNKLIGDPGRLQQILVNLLGNAVKFTEKGSVVLTVESRGEGRLEITVRDTGIGIELENLKSIFEDFAQADASTTRRYGGSGLGLAISRRLVNSMEGVITVDSTPGVGSVFRFTVALQPVYEPSLVPRGELVDLQKHRVLIIDNSETNRFILTEAFTSWGLKTGEADSARAGCDEIARAQQLNKPYALVIVDRQMPEMDGFAAVPLIRSVCPGIPIVMLTSDDRSGDSARRREANLTGYAVRPIKRADLLRLVCGALGIALKGSSSVVADPCGTSENNAKAGGLRILIADDSADNRILLRAYLKDSNHDLTVVEDGSQAALHLRNGRFDLVFMDVQMPVMDGLAATREIRQFERAEGLHPTPIIALTASALQHDVHLSLIAGCNAHLSKPISKTSILNAIARYGAHSDADVSESQASSELLLNLEELAAEYLRNRVEELPVLAGMLRNGNFDGIRVLAHNVKGTGGSFGFPDLTEMGDAMERAASQKSALLLSRQLQELDKFLQASVNSVFQTRM